MPAPPEYAPRLLQHDKEELDRVALRLGSSRSVFALIACEEALRPTALSYLREKAPERVIPDPVLLTDPEEVLTLLIEGTRAPPTVVQSFGIGEPSADVLRTLNWHREKLRGGASVLLWIGGAEGLGAMRGAAPDAYAFRDVVAVVRGDPEVPTLAPEEEPPRIQEARNQLRRAKTPLERASAASDVAGWLLTLDRYDEALGVTSEAFQYLAEVPLVDNAELEQLAATYFDSAARPDEPIHEISAELCMSMVALAYMRDASVDALHWIERGMRELPNDKLPIQRIRRLQFLCALPGEPKGPTRIQVTRVLDELTNGARPPWLYRAALYTMINIDVRLGALLSADRSLNEAMSTDNLGATGHAKLMLEKASIRTAAGRLREGNHYARDAARRALEAGKSAAAAAFHLAQNLALCGESAAAHRVLEELRVQCAHHGSMPWAVDYRVGVLEVGTGNVRDGLDRIRSAMRNAAQRGCDSAHFQIAEELVAAMLSATAGSILGREDLVAADAEIDAAEKASLAMVGADPPWYVILFPALRSELLALRPDRLPDAIHLAETALTRARAECPELAPKLARLHISHLIRAERFADALAALPVAEAEATQQGHLRELSNLQRLALVALVRTSQDKSAALTKLTALRETLESTGSLRIKADNLLDLAPALPPEITSPDPIALLEEAHALFLDMPMPGKEARCLEAMGDVLVALNRPAEAKRRYLAARRRCERYGLGLRLPLLTSKLDRLSTP